MKKIASALLLSAAISAPAFAANAGTSYVAVDYGTWSMSNVAPLPNPGVLTISGGYNFTPNWAAEVGYAIVGDSTVTDIFGNSITYSQSALKAAAVYTFPVNPQFDIFGKLGFDSISGKFAQTGFASQSASTSNLMYGIGVKYNINNNVGVRLQYEALGKTKAASSAPGSDVTSMSLGIVYGF